MIISSLRAKCLHHAHSRGQCAAVCKSLYNSSSAYHVQHVTCQGEGRHIAVSRWSALLHTTWMRQPSTLFHPEEVEPIWLLAFNDHSTSIITWGEEEKKPQTNKRRRSEKKKMKKKKESNGIKGKNQMRSKQNQKQTKTPKKNSTKTKRNLWQQENWTWANTWV